MTIKAAGVIPSIFAAWRHGFRANPGQFLLKLERQTFQLRKIKAFRNNQRLIPFQRGNVLSLPFNIRRIHRVALQLRLNLIGQVREVGQELVPPVPS